jgi:hypothetical protein
MATTESRPTGHHTTTREQRADQLRRLVERLAHELLDDEERQELRDRVLRLRRRLAR